MNQIFFWTQKDKYGAFSNFTKSPFILDGREWPTVEHYYQAMKSPYLMEQEAIRSAKTAYQAKLMGRKVELGLMWEDSKYQVMKAGLMAKFTQHADLKELLLSTGDAEIYEDSPKDFIWGTGMRNGVGSGQNLLGKALMEVREELRATCKTA